ncbi:PREDICTED: alkane hydroxylase MAH1-like [Tarenaya hassleriana]|uniref:alkane hydroxylase MAH1-like n=1 Tax=Tarenaya hassleriana TaxID=28532 RepID=UPI00053C9EB6|nr:PREDICTED: alkane hydroxylase MAH1-like [Tarenaya hassleriana]
MALIGSLEVSMAFFVFLLFRFLFSKKRHHALLTNWPFLGMLPGFTVEIPRFYDWIIQVLEVSNLTFLFKGPIFAGMDLLFTVDPANIHHILCSNFVNYPKGPDFGEIFDALGDGIFNADFELWKNLRKSAHALLSHHDFQRFTKSATVSVAKRGLVPLLDHAAKKNTLVDLQDVFQRFTFDTTLTLITGYNPKSLSIDMPRVELADAVEDAEEAIFHRHVKPRILWKLQNWIDFGLEKKLKNTVAIADRECAKYISMKREDLRRGTQPKGDAMDLLTYYMNLDENKYNFLNPSDDKFLRDTMVSFILAGRDTTSAGLTGFFWLLSKNPEAVAKIRGEISAEMPRSINRDDETQLDQVDLNKLVYLHGALYEALRLYPPVPFNHKSPAKADTLPSGHKVEANTKIIFPFYAMGRMRSVWGDDASEFKPERWISEKGRLKHEPSFKFASFNAGPRTCIGKQVALTQMAIVAVEILQNYDVITATEGQQLELVPSIILRTKHGYKVSITKHRLG